MFPIPISCINEAKKIISKYEKNIDAVEVKQLKQPGVISIGLVCRSDKCEQCIDAASAIQSWMRHRCSDVTDVHIIVIVDREPANYTKFVVTVVTRYYGLVGALGMLLIEAANSALGLDSVLREVVITYSTTAAYISFRCVLPRDKCWAVVMELGELLEKRLKVYAVTVAEEPADGGAKYQVTAWLRPPRL